MYCFIENNSIVIVFDSRLVFVPVCFRPVIALYLTLIQLHSGLPEVVSYFIKLRSIADCFTQWHLFPHENSIHPSGHSTPTAQSDPHRRHHRDRSRCRLLPRAVRRHCYRLAPVADFPCRAISYMVSSFRWRAGAHCGGRR